MKIYIVRHGETKNNTTCTTQGYIDSPLTELGIQQAQSIAQRLKNVKFKAVYSGDLPRQVRTANIILNANLRCDNIHIIQNKAFRELNFGKYDGGNWNKLFEPFFDEYGAKKFSFEDLLHYTNFIDCYQKIAEGDPTRSVEHPFDAFKRIFGVVNEIANNNTGNVLIVTSGVIMSILFSYLFEDFDRRIYISNNAVNIIEYKDNQYKILTVNNEEQTLNF